MSNSNIRLSNAGVATLAESVASSINKLGLHNKESPLRIYAVPTGGIPAAYAVQAAYQQYGKAVLVDHPDTAHVFVDDIIDSGATMQALCDENPGVPFFALIDKTGGHADWVGRWVIFPWEGDAVGSFASNVTRMLQFIGEDSNREGLSETPNRVAKAWSDYWAAGYKQKPEDVLKVFEDGAESYDEMVIVKNIPIYSHCEHHLAPIFGTATIAYIPDGKIVGLSKLSRLAEVFARRLQVQERLTNQIADAIQEHLHPKGVGVIIKARHLCMESRGICQQGHHTITSALRGVLKDQPETRAEFMDLAK